MNVSIFTQMAYENKSNWTLGENKPNSNPIKPKTNPIPKKAKMNVNIYYTKLYNNETAFRRIKNKPNSNPKQTQFPKGQNELKIACRKIWPHPPSMLTF